VFSVGQWYVAGPEEKNMCIDMIANRSDSSQILNKKIFSWSGMLWSNSYL